AHTIGRSRLVVFLAATAWLLPGIWWGLPQSTTEFVRRVWGVDELGPHGSLNAIRAMLGFEGYVTPQYPLAHYFVQALLVWPYHLAMLLADNVGLPPQSDSLVVLVLLHRLPSVLMTAGTVTAAAVLIRRISGSASSSWFVAAAVASIVPLLYYARTSNVDAAALFWTTVALLPATSALRDGLTARRAMLIGLCAAAAIATKDQQYAFFAGLAIVLAASHVHRVRAGVETGAAWKAPVLGAVVAIGAYLLLSGALILPSWFAGHIAFIREGSAAAIPQHLRGLIGTYFEHPATIAGYSQVTVDTFTLVHSAVGAPIMVLALIGGVMLAKENRWMLALLLVPVLSLFAGVIVPVRFVLARFVLPVDLVCCLLAGVAIAGALRVSRWRTIGQFAAAGTVGWAVLRGADLTWQMHADARYEAEPWLDHNLRRGDTLAYYGAARKLPGMRRDIVIVPAPDQYLPDLVYGRGGPPTTVPPFIIVIPQLPTESAHEWNVPDSSFTALIDTAGAYRQVLAIRTRSLFPRFLLSASSVNPTVRVFARRDIATSRGITPRVDVPLPGTNRP
ncbi:MAG: hypothetical protein ABMA00_18175, partial [Gemmatimonas sp.]